MESVGPARCCTEAATAAMADRMSIARLENRRCKKSCLAVMKSPASNEVTAVQTAEVVVHFIGVSLDCLSRIVRALTPALNPATARNCSQGFPT